MGQIITHTCGHEQIHYISGFASQQERKARWLETTKCRTCFAATKQAEQAEAAVRDSAAIAHLDLSLLTGSDRQVAWATSLRASRLCALVARPVTEGTGHQVCALITDAKWWIDHRALTDTELLAEAERYGPRTLIGHGFTVAQAHDLPAIVSETFGFESGVEVTECSDFALSETNCR